MKAAELRDPMTTAAYLDMASVTLFYALDRSEGLTDDESEWLFRTACHIDDMAARLMMEAVE